MKKNINTKLNKEEQWIEDHLEEYIAAPPTIGNELHMAAVNTVTNMHRKKPVTINLDDGAINYFKELSNETGIPYQNLINLYLVQCAEEKKRPIFA